MNNDNNQNNGGLMNMYGGQQPAAPVPEAQPVVVQPAVDAAQVPVNAGVQAQVPVDASVQPQVPASVAQPQVEPVITSTATVAVEMDEGPTADSTDVSNDDLLKAFVGDSYENFVNKKINLGALFFSSIYLFYRKMIIYGAVVGVINILLSSVKILSLFGIVINIVCGIFANKVYLNFAKKRVQQIKEVNRGMTRTQLIDTCKQDGGVSIGYAIGFPVAIGVVITVIKMILGL